MRTTDDEPLSVRVPAPMADSLRAMAARNYHSLSAEARQAFAEHLTRERDLAGETSIKGTVEGSA